MKVRRVQSDQGEWWCYVYCPQWPDVDFERLLSHLRTANLPYMIGGAFGDPSRLLSIGPLDAGASELMQRTWEDVKLRGERTPVQ